MVIHNHSLPNNLAVAVQCRLDSSRLPAKALLPLCGLSTLNFLFERLSISLPFPLFLLTTTNSADDLLIRQLPSSIPYFRGSSVNVLSRYLSFADSYGFDTIVRVTADNPFTDFSAILQLASCFTPNDSYLSFSQTSILEGCNAEIFNIESLTALSLSPCTSYELEHVTPLLRSKYTRRLDFSSSIPKSVISNYSLTIDTLYDYIKVSNLASKFNDQPSKLLLADHDYLLSLISTDSNFPASRNHTPQD